MSRFILFLFMLLMFFSIGCASIVSDNDSTTYVETDPENARCELHGQDFTRVVNTPTSINLPSEAAPITIACSAEGYKTTTQELDTHTDGWIIGNLIFGGIIGSVVDLARGAGNKYPTKVAVNLQPNVFATTADRDRWFDARISASTMKWDSLLKRERNKCSDKKTSAQGRCEKKIEVLESAKDEELSKYEYMRSVARVNGSSTPTSGISESSEEVEDESSS